MARERTAYRCRECGTVAPRWEGRCHGCGDWNTLVEEQPRRRRVTGEDRPRPVPVADVAVAARASRRTGLDELDRVLGGGLVPGSVALLGGEPGVGKSTLLLQALTSLARGGARCLLVCGEESAAQVRLRAERLGAIVPNLWLVADCELQGVVAPRTVISPALGSSSTPSTRCCPSTVTGIMRSVCSERSSTGSERPARSDCSR